MIIDTNKTTRNILIALVLGVVVGLILNTVSGTQIAKNSSFIFHFLEFLGSMFIKLMKLITVPVVLSSLTLGILNVGSITKFARLGIGAVLFFILTTFLAILMAVSIASFLNVGENASYLADNSLSYQAKEPSSILDVFLNIIPNNILAPMVNANMLQLITITILISIVVLSMSKENAEPIKGMFEHLERLAIGLINLVMKFAPLGVFALITKTFATQGIAASGPIAYYFGIVILVLFLHFTVSYSIIATLFGLNPIKFIKGILKVVPVAFSTSSSNATLPFTIKNANENLGVSKDISSFILPLGATINMDGTAIMQGVATVFLANIYGIDMSIFDYISVMLLAVLASIGTAGVPSVGLIMLTMILIQYNIPVDGIAIILGVDRLLDMTRTVVNVSGDTLATVILAKREGKLDINKFNSN